MSLRPLGSATPFGLRRPLAGGPLAVALVIAAGVTLVLPALGEGLVRIVLALPLVLVVPGYALALALLPAPRVGGGERLVLSLGLSLALAALGGFVLNWTPWGLGAQPWAAFLALTTLAAGAVAWVRRPPSNRQPVPLGAVTTSRRPGRRTALPALLMVLAALAAGAAWWTARSGAAQQASAGFTQLWTLPATEGGALTVRLGVRSREPVPLSYRVRLEVEGELVQEWPAVVLEPGEQWEATATLSPSQGAAGPVKAVLYRADAPATAYRHVLWWRNRGEPAPTEPSQVEPTPAEPAAAEPGQAPQDGEEG